ncbi:flavodoxin [Vibrio galatheae]|uniref:Flavodoxin n=1 Tax=Vibrio galatheae TaxID=579748 RepID=A0A0F4NLV1_9VIBR|nr:hypothetical protein [Vibrio galatheae]KJY83838.1 flavodoxin [Vibrio galatheae]
MTIPKIANIKNEWLYQQVDVEYPTKESIAGLALYKDKIAHCQYEQLSKVPQPSGVFGDEDLFLVDFHRLTVMFALLQSRQWQHQSDRDLILEFLSQIIYSEPCNLYLGFRAGEAVAAAIVTNNDEEILISDVVVRDEQFSPQDFISDLCLKLAIDDNNSCCVFVER